MIVYDDKDDNETSQKSIPQSSCKAHEYEITVRMSDKFFSGTNDKVEIRLYGQNGEITEWFELTKPSHDGFERLSQDMYRVKTQKRPEAIGRLEKIGIRKFGSDSMMIDEILIRSNHKSMVFQVGQWINTDTIEHTFELAYEY